MADTINNATGKTESYDVFNFLPSERDMVKGRGLRDILLTISRQMKPEEFEFKNDKEFVSNFAKKYDILCRGASADVFLRSLEEMMNANRYSVDQSLIECKAAIELCKELKVQYEDRMELIRSPYYALLVKNDLDVYEGPEGKAKLKSEVRPGNQRFIEYIERYQRLRSAPLGKNADLRAAFDAKVQRIRNETRIRDIERVNALGIDYTQSAKQNIDTLFERKYEEYLASNAETSDWDYLRKTKPKTSDTKIDGIDGDDIYNMEVLLLEICEKNTINGLPVKNEDAEEIKGFVTEMTKTRRKMDAQYEGMLVLDFLAQGNIDLENPMFANTAQGRAYRQMRKAQEEDEERYEAFRSIRVEYMNQVVSKMKELSGKGYSIYPKYEDRVKDEAWIDQGVEDFRKNQYEEFYYRSHPKEKKAEGKRVEFPTFTVNGKHYRTYGMEGFMESLNGQEILVDEKNPNREEILGLFEQLDAVYKKMAAVKGEYFAQDKGKKFTYDVLMVRFGNEKEPLEARLIQLLKNDIPKVREYSDSKK